MMIAYGMQPLWRGKNTVRVLQLDVHKLSQPPFSRSGLDKQHMNVDTRNLEIMSSIKL